MSTVAAKYSIEKPTLKHFNAIIDLWQEQYEYHHHLDPHYYVAVTGPILSTLREYVLSSIEKEEPHMLIARCENTVAGFITFKTNQTPYFASNIQSYGQIIEQYVSPEHRREGIGGLLTKTVESFFTDLGISYIIVQSSTNNPRASDFYLSEGYTPRQTQYFKSL